MPMVPSECQLSEWLDLNQDRLLHVQAIELNREELSVWTSNTKILFVFVLKIFCLIIFEKKNFIIVSDISLLFLLFYDVYEDCRLEMIF